MKCPPPVLRLQRPVSPHRGGLIDNLCSRKKAGVGDRAERMGNKESELTSNAWFTYTDLKLPVVSPFQYIVAREGNEITLTIMCHKEVEWGGEHVFPPTL